MKGQIVEKIVAVDWSGRVDAAGQRRHICAGVWERGRPVAVERGRTRVELVEWLIAEAKATPRMVVGVDFCFSYPAWFLEELGVRSAVEFWEVVRGHGEDGWLSRRCEDERFWGRPRKKPAQFAGNEGARRMLRLADVECKLAEEIGDASVRKSVRGIAPKSPFQIGGAGAVGTGTLRGIPFLPVLRAAGFSVWPFDRVKLPLLVEIYPRLLTGSVHKSRVEARKKYLRENVARTALTRAAWRAAEESEDAFDAVVSALRMGERAEEFLQLKQAKETTRLLEGKVWGAGRH